MPISVHSLIGIPFVSPTYIHTHFKTYLWLLLVGYMGKMTGWEWMEWGLRRGETYNRSTWRRRWALWSASGSWPAWSGARAGPAAPLPGCPARSGWSSWPPPAVSLSCGRWPSPPELSVSVAPPPHTVSVATAACLPASPSSPRQEADARMAWVLQGVHPGRSYPHGMTEPCSSRWASTASKRQREKLPTGRDHRNPRQQQGDWQRCLGVGGGGKGLTRIEGDRHQGVRWDVWQGRRSACVKWHLQANSEKESMKDHRQEKRQETGKAIINRQHDKHTWKREKGERTEKQGIRKGRLKTNQFSKAEVAIHSTPGQTTYIQICSKSFLISPYGVWGFFFYK